MLLVNEILHGRYRIIRQLGHGGMGAVYEAHDSVFETTVALKEILIDTSKSSNPKQHEMILRAFEREAKILAKIKHEAVPHVRDYFTDANRQFLVMELVEGKDLGDLLEERKVPFPLDDVLRWMDQLLDGLDYLHTQNPPIYHRDLKPQNLKLTPRGKIKLLDFGIAKGGAEVPNSATINNQTFVAATLNYSPIEQIFRVLDPVFREVLTQRFEHQIKFVMEQNADARSDIYALGATAYHLLTAVLPIDALKRTMEVWSGKPDPLQHPLTLNNRIPPEVGALLLKAMQLDHGQRYVSALDMQQALQQAINAIRLREANQAQPTVATAGSDAWAAEQERLRQIEAQRLQQTRLPQNTSQNDATQQISPDRLPISEQTLQGGGMNYQVPSGQNTGGSPPPFGQNTGGQQNTSGQPLYSTAANPFHTGSAATYQTGGEQMPPGQVNFAGASTGGAINNVYPTGGAGFPNQPVSYGQGYPHSGQTLVPKKSSRKILWILPVLVLMFLALGSAGFGFWLWQKSQVEVNSQPTPTPTATATPAPSPSATPLSTNSGVGGAATPTLTPTRAATATPSIKAPVQTRPPVIPPSKQPRLAPQTRPRDNEPSARPKSDEPSARPKSSN